MSITLLKSAIFPPCLYLMSFSFYSPFKKKETNVLCHSFRPALLVTGAMADISCQEGK